MSAPQRLMEKSQSVENVTSTRTGEVLDLDGASSISIQCVADVNTPAADTFAAGEAEITTLTFDTQANTGDGDYVVVYDTTGQAWAVAADKTGASATPTGAVWTAIAAANKAQADISGATTAVEVAAAFEAAFDGITGFTAVILSDDTAADGTMTMTQVVRGPATAAVVYAEDDGSAGSISAAETNAGVASTIDLTADSITMTAHGHTTGLKGQVSSTGTIPGGLMAVTDYFVVVVDENTIKLASSLANALAGTAIDLTDQGTDGATHTFTPTSLAGASVKLEKSNNGTDWSDVATATNITADGDVWVEDDTPNYRYGRISYTVTAGRFSATSHILVKG